MSPTRLVLALLLLAAIGPRRVRIVHPGNTTRH